MMENRLLYRYSPPENMLGIIYSARNRRERFHRFVTEAERVWLGSINGRYLLKEFPLGPRTAHLFLKNVLTADHVYLELELKIFYRVDPRKANEANRIQVINMASHEAPVRTHAEERVRNEILIQFTAEEALSHRGRKNIRAAISALVSDKVKGMGITVNPQFGAAIINMQPHELYQRALQEEAAALSQGNAAYKRVAPALQNLDAAQALQVLYTHLASTMTKTDTMPAQVYTMQNGNQNKIQDIPPFGNLPEGPTSPPSLPPRRPRSERQYPIAAD